MWSINSREDFCVSLLEVCASIGLLEDAQLAPDTPQLTGPPSVQAEPLVRHKILSGHNSKQFVLIPLPLLNDDDKLLTRRLTITPLFN